MSEFNSFLAVLLWLSSAGGLGIVSSFLTDWLKRLFKLADLPARALAFVISAVVGVGAIYAIEYGVYQAIEPYWKLLLPVLVFAWSQLTYFLGPRHSA
jgi:hypothetical protein